MSLIWILILGVGALIVWSNRDRLKFPDTEGQGDTGGQGQDNERPGEPGIQEVYRQAYAEAVDPLIVWLNTNERVFNDLYDYDNRNCGDDKFAHRQDQEAWMNGELIRSIDKLQSKHNNHRMISVDDFDWLWNFSRSLADVWEAHVAALNRHDVACGRLGVRTRVEAWLTVLSQYGGLTENLSDFYAQYGAIIIEYEGPVYNDLPLPAG